MFKEIVSKLTQKTLNSAKTTSGFVADTLVSNLQNRSPVLGNLAGKYLESKRAKAQFGRDQVQAARIYASENVDKDFGQEVKKEHKGLEPEDLAKKMEEILSNLQKTSEKSPEKLEADPLYKKYGKFFKENKEQFKASKENKSNGSGTGSPADSSDIITKLESIEANTAETAKHIANLTKNKESVEETDSRGPVIAELKKISKFLEIQTNADKQAAIQAAEDQNEGLDVKKDPSVLQSLMAKIKGKDANGPETNRSPSLLDKVRDRILGNTAPNKPGLPRDGLKNSPNSRPTIRDGLKNSPNSRPTIRDGLKNTAKNNVKIPAGASKLGGVVKSVGSVGARALAGIGTFASSAAGAATMGAAGVAAAGYGGYKAGEWLNENTDIQSNIASGIETAKGWFGNSTEDKIKDADKKAAQDLYEKRVSEGKLNSKSAALFEQQGVKVDKSKIVDMPTPVKSTLTTAVTSTVAAQDNLAVKSTPQIQPILLNTKTSTPSGSSGLQMITGVNVRNSDTTFERVQMQDFWPRTE